MGKVLPQSFFQKPALEVAPALLGKVLVQKDAPTCVITEVEAYTGPDDKACHAYKGRTKRTEVMFGAAGHWYVYLVYGMYWMLNIVVDEVDHPAAVLIRGGEAINSKFEYRNPKQIQKTKLKDSKHSDLNTVSNFGFRASDLKLDGPGKLTQALHIDKRYNGKPALKKTGLWIENRNIAVSKKDITSTPRIGVSYAEEWADKPFRFILKQND